MPKKSRNFRFRLRAFSLIEVSVVILIIGIIISGIFVADRMISQFRISAAQTLTQSAPVHGQPSLALWLESSMDSSFNAGEQNNGASLSTWFDQKTNSSKVLISTAGASPTYANTINRVHAVEFDGTSNKHFTFDGSFLNDTDYTIFVLEKRKSASTNNYFLGATGGGLNNSLVLGYSADNQIVHSQGSNSYASGISTYATSQNQPRVFTFRHSASGGKQTYINGVLAAEDITNTAPLTGISTLAIGQGYIGEIGEIAIFTKALSASDRAVIEDYLGKKWNSPINRLKSPSCIGGLVTVNGCDNSSPITCSASGVGYTQTGLAYTSGGSFNCDSGYSGTISYRCMASGPATNISGSCTPPTCTAPAGTGYNAQSNLPYAASGSGSFNCDVAGYSGSKSYTCTSAGVATGIGGSCTPVTCTASGTGYVNKTGLAYATAGSGSFTCDSGFTGTINYTCTTSGPATITGGTCLPGSCSGGVIDTTSVPGYTIHTYSSVGSFSFQCPSARNVEVLVVAGGGGGSGVWSAAGGCGGGAGGLIHNTSFAVSTSSIPVVVGDGGNGGAVASHVNGSNGSPSSFSTLSAAGGGGGGGRESAGSAGGSGGGGGISGQTKAGGAATPSGQGNPGGNNYAGGNYYGGGGGGGAGAAGQNGTAMKGGNGGVGLQKDISGTPTYYAGGGASSYYTSTAANGTPGLGGGGSVGSAGASATGGGGGGANLGGGAGFKGGSGIVIVRYAN